MPLALQGLPLLVGPLFSVTHSESAEGSAHGRCSIRERSAEQSVRGTCRDSVAGGPSRSRRHPCARRTCPVGPPRVRASPASCEHEASWPLALPFGLTVPHREDCFGVREIPPACSPWRA